MRKKTLVAILTAMLSLPISAQITVSGDIKDTGGGHQIKYVSLRVDSLHTISDKDGNFTLRIPKGHKSDLIVSHLSYKTLAIPYARYKSGNLHICLQEKVQAIEDVAIAASKAKMVKVGR